MCSGVLTSPSSRQTLSSGTTNLGLSSIPFYPYLPPPLGSFLLNHCSFPRVSTIVSLLQLLYSCMSHCLHLCPKITAPFPANHSLPRLTREGQSLIYALIKLSWQPPQGRDPVFLRSPHTPVAVPALCRQQLAEPLLQLQATSLFHKGTPLVFPSRWSQRWNNLTHATLC